MEAKNIKQKLTTEIDCFSSVSGTFHDRNHSKTIFWVISKIVECWWKFQTIRFFFSWFCSPKSWKLMVKCRSELASWLLAWFLKFCGQKHENNNGNHLKLSENTFWWTKNIFWAFQKILSNVNFGDFFTQPSYKYIIWIMVLV